MDREDRETLTRVETKVDQLLEYRQDHETRLRALERMRWIMQGAWLIIGAGLAWIAKHF